MKKSQANASQKLPKNKKEEGKDLIKITHANFYSLLYYVLKSRDLAWFARGIWDNHVKFANSGSR